RRADRTLTGAAGALLAVRLLATTADRGPRLGLRGALSRGGELGDDDLVDQRHVRGDVEDRGGQLGGAGLLARGVQDVDGLGVSHGHAPFTAVRTTTTPRFGPGIGPATSSRPLSTSTAWIVRFWVVWRLWPMRPAIRWPRNTRPGVEAPPIEPGLRWLRCAPWEAPTPEKP